MCNDKTVKELLPSYIEEGLDQADAQRVGNHLAFCDDCRTELSLLRIMAEGLVPDPGEAFWAALPDRVSLAVQKHQAKRKTFDLSRLLDWPALPRWTWAAVTMGTVLIISWFLIMPLQNKKTETPQSQGNEYADEISDMGSVSVADLDHDEVSSIDTWAGSELTSIGEEAEPVLVSGRDINIYEELEDLNEREVKQLSIMLAEIEREG